MIRSSIFSRLLTMGTLFVAGAFVWAGPTQAQLQGQAPLEVLYGFTLIDGTGAPPIEDAAIAVRGNEIVTVASRLELLSGPDAPRDAIVTNLGGGYVVPGLIDAHVHLATVPNRQRAEAQLYKLLYGGVTAVRDMAGDGRALTSLARDARLGQIPSPDIYYSALMAGASFLSDPRPQSSAAGEVAGEVPWMQAITPETDLATAVAMARGTSATGIKIYANLEPAEVANITREAHRQDMKVWAHSMVFPTRPLDVIRSDVDVISHVCRIAWEGMADAPTEYHHDQVPLYGNFSAASPVFTELFDEMRARGTILDATLAMYARAADDPEDPLSDRCDLDFARALVARAAEQGIPIAAGTDFMTAPEDPLPALYDELEELVNGGGLTPMQAIESATRVAAEAIGAEDTYGTLVHGRPVSFVLVDDDPLADIANLRSIKAVWKNGERYDRNAYRRPVADEDDEAAPMDGPASAQAAIDGWLAAWRSYDLDELTQVLLNDPSLTYFANDAEGTIEGITDVLTYHEGLGFVRGGFQPENELWLEDVLVANFDESAVVSAVWHFGNRVLRSDAARGPFTMVVVRTRAGYRITHVNMGNYAVGGDEGGTEDEPVGH
jgi:imidazolonepropionase-like amidohydrolase